MMEVILTNKTRSLDNPLRVSFCESFICRLKGLMFRKDLDPGEGLLMVQPRESIRDASIHMFFVGMDIGVVWLDSDRVVVDLQLAKSWKPYYAPAQPARYILEIHPERLPEFNMGDLLSFEED
jgi:uncharacterized membrane protein (UPF0127 family)